MNLNKHFNLSAMNEGVRYHLCYLNRLAEARGFSKSSDPPMGKSFFLPGKEDCSKRERLLCFFLDSLMVGLATDEPLLALRCLLQAVELSSKLSQLGEILPNDSMGVLRMKVENAVKNAI